MTLPVYNGTPYVTIGTVAQDVAGALRYGNPVQLAYTRFPVSIVERQSIHAAIANAVAASVGYWPQAIHFQDMNGVTMVTVSV